MEKKLADNLGQVLASLEVTVHYRKPVVIDSLLHALRDLQEA